MKYLKKNGILCLITVIVTSVLAAMIHFKTFIRIEKEKSHTYVASHQNYQLFGQKDTVDDGVNYQQRMQTSTTGDMLTPPCVTDRHWLPAVAAKGAIMASNIMIDYGDSLQMWYSFVLFYNIRDTNAIRQICQSKIKQKFELKSRKRLVVIVTYMRSGSSFTGDIIQQHPNVFYLFEPFISLKRKIQRHSPFDFLNGTDSESLKFFEAVESTMRKLSFCDLGSVDRIIWMQSYFLSMSRKMSKYKNCLDTPDLASKAHLWRNHCISALISECKKSDVILIKTIRIPISLLSRLMHEIPDMRIIHLMRDPRATISSISKYGSNTNRTTNASVYDFCTRILKDVATVKMFQSQFPGRVIRAVYEKLATNTIKITKDIFKFMDLDYTDRIESYISRITGAKSNECGDDLLCTTSQNSTRQIEKWRTSTPFRLVDRIQKHCPRLFSELILNVIPNRRALRSIETFPLTKIKDGV